MDKQKQIEEMAKAIENSDVYIDSCDSVSDGGEYAGQWVESCVELAEYLYNAGYRKESETAKEIYEILEKWAWKLKNEKGSLGNFAFGIETAMQEIKEKYSLQVGNFKLVELKKGKKDGT